MTKTLDARDGTIRTLLDRENEYEDALHLYQIQLAESKVTVVKREDELERINKVDELLRSGNVLSTLT